MQKIDDFVLGDFRRVTFRHEDYIITVGTRLGEFAGHWSRDNGAELHKFYGDFDSLLEWLVNIPFIRKAIKDAISKKTYWRIRHN